MEPTEEPVEEPVPGRTKVAYIMSRFPKLTETFILYEILAVEKLGIPVEIYPLQRERTTTMHPEAVDLVERAHFEPLVSPSILRAHLHYLRTKPATYFRTLRDVLRGNLGSARYFFGALTFFPKIVRFARDMEQRGVTHVHAHFASHPALAGFIIRRLADIPYSFTAHGSDLHRDRTMLGEKMAEASTVVTISEFNRALILEEFGEEVDESLEIIRCGVDTSRFTPRTTALRSERCKALRIGCIGTLHEVKGQRYLIEACRLLADRGIDFECYFIGDGPDRKMLEELSTGAGLDDRIHFLGKLKQAELTDKMSELDVVAAPSVPTKNGRREGIPVVLMEAIASGIPVIGSRITGVPELVEHGRVGFVVESFDVDALASALQRLAEDRSLRRRLGAAGREKAVAEYDLETNTEALSRHFTGSELE